ncbi:MAG: (2Fe-2S)-binding protein [Xanthomonadales bacterium]|nr:(2Fe-2S)-binding protein [Xanthomonadales bacterium]
MKKMVKFTLNGKPVQLDTESDQSLLWLLRGDMELTGTKYGCGVGLCGACTVLVDGTAQRACMLDVQSIANKKLTTIEGLAEGDNLHPVQQAFVDHDALQCGYCTPGMILSAVSLLKDKPEATEADIADGLDDNLCRCGAHKRIVKAVRSVALDQKT